MDRRDTEFRHAIVWTLWWGTGRGALHITAINGGVELSLKR